MEVAGLVVPVFAIIVTGWLGYIPRSLGDGFVMSCQCARSTGQFAGHNAVADLFSLPMLPLQIDSYVTVLDPGGWGALYTVGWDRQVHALGASAKMTKQNRERIYRPRTRSRSDLLAAGPPTIQAPPRSRTPQHSNELWSNRSKPVDPLHQFALQDL